VKVRTSRRSFLKGASAAGFAAAFPRAAFVRPRGFEEKLKVGVVGVANRAAANLNGVAKEEIVALCDIDSNYLGKAAARFPEAKTFADFRELIAQPGLDAIVVSTPDHTHAPAAAQALRAGLHVYCEKPLTHSVHEAQVLRKLARENECITQMGTQIHSGGNYRRVVEVIRSGAIGSVSEVHVFCNKSWSGGERPTETPEVPAHIDYDLWLGPAPERPYHPAYLPAGWRRWWDFGGGTLADMGCHYMDLAHWALELTTPIAARAEGAEPHAETTPKPFSAHWKHAAKGERAAVDVSWYDGGVFPGKRDELGLQAWGNGVLFIGERGWLISSYDNYVLGPQADFVEYKAPEPWIPDSIGHHAEWIDACKNGGPTTCNFEYSGALTETVLLGNVAYRSGEKLEWDSAKGLVTNSEAAQKFIAREYREGWSL
jgi:predicted dehydrogenase